MWFVAQEGGATSGATRARNLAHVGNASTNNQPNNIINYPGRYISKPASCSHTSINGSCINYKFYNRPGNIHSFTDSPTPTSIRTLSNLLFTTYVYKGVTLQNGTTSSSCLIISCQPLPQVSSLSAMYQGESFAIIIPFPPQHTFVLVIFPIHHKFAHYFVRVAVLYTSV